MAIARKIAYNVVASSVCKILSTALALVSIGFITRYLGKDGFGEYATILAFLAFFSAIGDLGINHISTREISRQGADESAIIGKILLLRIIVSMILFVFSPLLVLFLPYSVVVKQGIIVIAASYFFSSSYQVLNGVFQKHLALDKVVFSEFLGKIIQLGVIIFAIQMKLSLAWIISSLLIYMIFVFGLVIIWSRQYIRFSLQVDKVYWKKFLTESYPLGIAAVITFVYFKVDTIMLSLMRDSSDVGVYNAAYKVIENIAFFPTMIVGLVFPIMAHTVTADKARFQDISDKTIKVFFILVTPLVVGTFFLAPNIIDLIGGSSFAESAAVLQILILALAFIFFGNFFNSILIAAGHQRKLMSVLSLAAVFSVVANLILIPRISYWSTAIVSVLTECLVVIIGWQLTRTKVKYSPKVEKLWAIILAGGLMAVFLFFLRQWPFVVKGSGSVAIYILFLWIFEAVKTQEITSIISKKGVEEYEEMP